MKIKGYTIESEISRGPITSAFLANQTTLDRQVLLKVLNVQWRDDADLVERFRREAKISARLKHPNIVTIFDFGISDHAFYIAMEYIDGQALSAFIKKNHPLPYPLVVYLLRETLQGLSYAHQKEVLHRDIKPGNIMIGDDGSIKITDFGLATIAEYPRLTNQDDIVGTPAYMSPEQAKGLELDYRSDLFSLGVTLYEMLTGKSPFLDRNLALTVNNIITQKPSLPRELKNDLPIWLSELPQSLLEKDIQQRPESVQVILDNNHDSFKKIDYQEIKPFFKHLSAESSFRYSPADSNSKERDGLKHRKPLIYVSIIVLILVIVTVYFFQYDRNIIKSNNLSSLTSSVDTSIKNDPVESTLKENFEKNENPVNQIISPTESEGPIKLSLESTKNSNVNLEREVPENSIISRKIDENSFSKERNGQLFIACHPWADIFINGRYNETTPLMQPISVIAGIHILELRNPNYYTYQKEITITPDKIDTLSIKLEPAMGYLNIQVIPWGEIYIDSLYLETTPLTEPLTVFAGKHQVSITNPNYSAIIDTIFIEAGKTTERVFNFEP
jgi:serine/threonine-protein kinase